MKRTVKKEDIVLLAEVSQDFNPIHLNQDYAQHTPFKRCIAHGLFCLGMISKIVGMDLPGEGAVFINETVNYKNPVYIGDEVEATVRIIALRPEKSIVKIGFECKNQNDELLMDGDMLVKMV